MNLRELFTPSEKTVTRQNPYDISADLKIRNDRLSDPDKNTGYYSQGYPDKTDPFLFNKETHMPSKLNRDAYYNYINASKTFASENPYFPRVFGITYKKDPDGLVKPFYSIEKLVSLKELTHEELGALIDKIFVDWGDPDAIDNNITVRNFVEKFKKVCVKADRRRLEFKDKKLIQALNLIDEIIAKDRNFAFDIQIGNIMVRRTSVGNQLVLSDPIDDDGASIVVSKDGI